MGVGCGIYYNDYYAWIRISVTGLNAAANTDLKDVIKYPAAVGVNVYGYRHTGSVLTSSWRPSSTQYYLSLGGDGVTLRVSAAVSNGVIAADMCIPAAWLNITG